MKYTAIVDCQLCNSRHLVNADTGTSINTTLNNQDKLPLVGMTIAGSTWKIICRQCEKKNEELLEKQLQERNEFNGSNIHKQTEHS